jgi:hypothetical protein
LLKNPILYILFFFVFTLLTACKHEKRFLTSGEYSQYYGQNLHLSTRDDGTIYAWFASDSSAQDTAAFALLCVSHYPKANIAAWVPPYQTPTFFGTLTHLGEDSFSIKMETPINSSPLAKALASEKGLFFTLQTKHADWQNFYFWADPKSCFLYEKPDFKSKKHAVNPKSHLYSSELIGEWAKINTDSSTYWAHRSSVY